MEREVNKLYVRFKKPRSLVEFLTLFFSFEIGSSLYGVATYYEIRNI